MKAYDQIELKISLLVNRLATLEQIAISEDNKHLISVELIDEEIEIIGSEFLQLFKSSGQSNVIFNLNMYSNEILKTEHFKNKVSWFTKRAFDYLESEEVKKNRDLLKDTPESITSVMNSLARTSFDRNHRHGGNFDMRYFVSQYLIYRVKEQNYIYNTKTVNKKELFDKVYGKNPDEELLNKIKRVQEDYDSIFHKVNKNHNLDTDISYETVKKRLQKILPKQNRQTTMDNSQTLNVFKEHAFLVLFLIYHTRYQRFMSNSNTQNPPDFKEFKYTKDAIQDFLLSNPISGINDELFLNTVMQDSHHFSFFNAVTKLTSTFMNEVIGILEIAKNYDSLTGLFIVDKMIDVIPSISSLWGDNFETLVFEVGKFSREEEVKTAVEEATQDIEAVEFVESHLLSLFEKYGTIYNDDEAEDPVSLEEKVSNDLFKLIVKLYYQTEDGTTAYQK